MTSLQSAQGGMQQHQFGTLNVVGWAGDYGDGRDMAFLLLFSLGDGPATPEETTAAMRQFATDLGLSVGGDIVDATAPGRRQFPVTALVEGGQVALSLPGMRVQYATPPEWVTAAHDRGHLYFLLATRPWSQGNPGGKIEPEALRAFVSDETLATSAHCLLPVMRVAR
ncbi:hypothetical protein FM076_23200 [Streptomyces albus subsp. chlorinus]|uniref:DUF5949 family protein n=1 Tax=Streptomyces albus TaxID=1888 RepID=UPI00157000C9|nr:DUF5949 family protein [Streptomyces albus]NSC23899.1 hypothetical protein [Streptomyces albus subsp. chlorinus]